MSGQIARGSNASLPLPSTHIIGRQHPEIFLYQFCTFWPIGRGLTLAYAGGGVYPPPQFFVKRKRVKSGRLQKLSEPKLSKKFTSFLKIPWPSFQWLVIHTTFKGPYQAKMANQRNYVSDGLCRTATDSFNPTLWWTYLTPKGQAQAKFDTWPLFKVILGHLRSHAFISLTEIS